MQWCQTPAKRLGQPLSKTARRKPMMPAWRLHRAVLRLPLQLLQYFSLQVQLSGSSCGCCVPCPAIEAVAQVPADLARACM